MSILTAAQTAPQTAGPEASLPPEIARSWRGRRIPGAALWLAIRTNRKAAAGAILLGVFILMTAFPNWFARDNPTSMRYPVMLGPSWGHFFGTTNVGQDVWAQLVYGTRQSMYITFAVGALSTAIAVIIGVSAAYLGGAADGVLSLFTDVILVIPTFPLIIVIAGYLHNSGSGTLIIVLGLLGWSYGARQFRSQVLAMRNRDFLEAARVRGERKIYIILFEILPTMTSLIVASFLGAALYALLTAAALQFVGLGNPNAMSWGTMLYWATNENALQAGGAWWAIMPGVMIALLGAALALINYAFDEISNPALRPVRAVVMADVADSVTPSPARAGGPRRLVPRPLRNA